MSQLDEAVGDHAGPADKRHIDGTPRGPLHGYRVLDLTSVVMGPFATQILGDLGADVITVEPPDPGGNRFMGPGPHKYFSGISLNLLRNKRNISVDIKQPEGRAIVLRLAETCDVFVTNLRPAPLSRLRLEYEDVAAVRPDIVYCQAQGFATDGPRCNDPAYDDIIQSATGVADAFRRISGEPAVAPTILADKLCGLTIVYAVLAALLHRERTGRGQRVEVPMFDVMRAFMLVEHGAGAISEPPVGPAGYGRVLNPYRRPQKTADGWIHMLPYSGDNFDAVFRVGARDDLVGDERARGRGLIDNAGWLYQQLLPIVATRTTAYWHAFCDEHRVPFSEVAELEDLVAALPIAEHPLAGSYRVIPTPVTFSNTPSAPPKPAGIIGADSEAILGELGFDDVEVELLRSRRTVRFPPSQHTRHVEGDG